MDDLLRRLRGVCRECDTDRCGDCNLLRTEAASEIGRLRAELDSMHEMMHALIKDRDELRARVAELEAVVSWAQCVLTALNVGDVKSESPLHKKLREVMIAYRAEQAGGGDG